MEETHPFRQHATGALGRWDEEFETRMQRTEKAVRSAYNWNEGQQIQFHTLWRLQCLLGKAVDEQAMRRHATDVVKALPQTFSESYDQDATPTVDGILQITRESLPVPGDIVSIMKMGNAYRSLSDHETPFMDRTPESTLFMGMIYQHVAPLLNKQQRRDLQNLIKGMNKLHWIVATRGSALDKVVKSIYDPIGTFVRNLTPGLREQLNTVVCWVEDYLHFLISWEEAQSYTGTNTYYKDTLGFVTVPAFAKGDTELSDEQTKRFRYWKRFMENVMESFTLKFHQAINESRRLS